MPVVYRFCKVSPPGVQHQHQHRRQAHKKLERYTMSDTLKSNPDQSDVDVDGNAISFQPLFEDEEGDSTLAAPQPPNRRRRTWFIVVSIVLLAALIGGGVLFYLQ